VDWVKSYFESNPDASFVVTDLNVGGNTKAISSAIQHVKGMSDKAALFVSVDPETQKVSHMSIVPSVCFFSISRRSMY
jgi:alanyl-tRNA synthetase